MYSEWYVVATYLDDLSDIRQHVATIRLQDNLVAIVRPLPNICDTPGGYWVFTNKINVLRGNPTACGREG